MNNHGLSRRALLGSLAAGAALAATQKISPALAALDTAMRGVFPIAFTPVDANDKVDYDGMISEVRFCQKGGVHGLAWPQIASGWTVLSEAERRAGAEALLSARKYGKTRIVIGVQSPDIAATQRYAEHAQSHGADAIICIPPAGMTDEAQLLDFYRKVGSFTTLPLFLQSGGTMSTDLLVKMYETIPNFRYVKDEAGNPLERVAELNARTQGGLNVFSGNGVTTLITEMERGFKGHCPFTSLSDIYAAAFDAFHAGNRQKAFQLHGVIEAASRMFAQNNIQIMVARGVFKPGTRGRLAPLAPGSVAAGAYMPASTADQIARILDTYLKPYLRA
jgi:4-hydroxy-tetrahydrodipicolinate synthase